MTGFLIGAALTYAAIWFIHGENPLDSEIVADFMRRWNR